MFINHLYITLSLYPFADEPQDMRSPADRTNNFDLELITALRNTQFLPPSPNKHTTRKSRDVQGKRQWMFGGRTDGMQRQGRNQPGNFSGLICSGPQGRNGCQKVLEGCLVTCSGSILQRRPATASRLVHAGGYHRPDTWTQPSNQ